MSDNKIRFVRNSNPSSRGEAIRLLMDLDEEMRNEGYWTTWPKELAAWNARG